MCLLSCGCFVLSGEFWVGFKRLLTRSSWHDWFKCKQRSRGVKIIKMTAFRGINLNKDPDILPSVIYKVLRQCWCEYINENRWVPHKCVTRLLLLSERFPPCMCSSSPWVSWTSSPHGQGSEEESAQWEFREVNKWVWNVSVSHAAYLHTQALRKHVSGLRTAKLESHEVCLEVSPKGLRRLILTLWAAGQQRGRK